jgi:hypothetical protein
MDFRFGKKQLSKIGVKTKVSCDCFFSRKTSQNGQNQVRRERPRPLLEMTESRQPIANLGDNL